MVKWNELSARQMGLLQVPREAVTKLERMPKNNAYCCYWVALPRLPPTKMKTFVLQIADFDSKLDNLETRVKS